MKINTDITTMVSAFSVLLSLAAVPAYAAGSASPISVKIGYFNLILVKASYPEAAGSEMLRITAENQLRRDVEAGNKGLQKLQDDKKPREEIEKESKLLQTEINAKQRALTELIQTQLQTANQQIARAVAQVAKEKSLDLVVDGAGVFSGGDKIVSGGEDITEAVMKKLSPSTARASGSSEKTPAAK